MMAGLRRRSPDELAAFAGALLWDTRTGAGDYARALAAGNCAAAAQVVRDGIGCWAYAFKHFTYHQAGLCAQRLEWTLDAIEYCVAPRDPEAALALLELFFEADEATTQDDLEQIGGAFKRAAEIFKTVGKACPPDRVRAARARLLAEDRHGYRAWLGEAESGGSKT